MVFGNTLIFPCEIPIGQLANMDSTLVKLNSTNYKWAKYLHIHCYKAAHISTCANLDLDLNPDARLFLDGFVNFLLNFLRILYSNFCKLRGSIWCKIMLAVDLLLIEELHSVPQD